MEEGRGNKSTLDEKEGKMGRVRGSIWSKR